VRAGSRLLPAVTLVPRSLCTFRRVPLTNRTRAGLRAASLQAEQELNAARPRSIVVPDRNGAKWAGVWSWDAATSADEPAAAKASLEGMFTVPEPVARAGAADGVRLVKGLEGYDGEAWQNGNLTASRWWPDIPSDSEWTYFVRSARALPGDTRSEDGHLRPEPAAPDWLGQYPPLAQDERALARTVSPARLAGGLFVVVLAVLSFRVAEFAVYSAQSAKLEARLADASEARANIARLRRVAQSQNAIAKSLSQIGDEMLVVDAITQTLMLLPPEDLNVQQASFAEGELTVRAGVLNPVNAPDLVKDLEAIPGVEEAFIESGASNRTVSVRLKTRLPVTPSQ